MRPIAGGTALMLMMKAGVFRPTRLVSLRNVEAHHSAIEATPDGDLADRRDDAARGRRALRRRCARMRR